MRASVQKPFCFNLIKIYCQCVFFLSHQSCQSLSVGFVHNKEKEQKKLKEMCHKEIEMMSRVRAKCVSAQSARMPPRNVCV